MLKCLLLLGRSCIGDGYKLQCSSKQAGKQVKLNYALFQKKNIENIDIEAIFNCRICSWEWLFVVPEYF